MKIKIIRPTVFRKKAVEPSETPIEVTAREAMDLIGAGKAVAVKDAPVENADKPLKEAESRAIEAPELVKELPVEAPEVEPPITAGGEAKPESGKKTKKKAGA